MKIIAHRCGDTRYPEGSMEAARHALAAGADYLEVDIRHTKDGSTVVTHDADLVRMFDVNAAVADLGDMEYRELRYSDGQTRPRFLEEFLTAGVGPLVLHIKEGGRRLETLIERIEYHNFGGRVVLGVETLDDLRMVKAADNGYTALAFAPGESCQQAFVDGGADIVRLWDPWVSADRVAEIHGHGREVWVMTGTPLHAVVGITTAARLRELQHLGVDGVLVNDVELAARALGR